MMMMSGFSAIAILIYLGLLGVGIYVTILVIKALRIYIEKNS